jgi:hypothetical protein
MMLFAETAIQLNLVAVATLLKSNSAWNVGWVYIFTTKSMPDIVKIGYTTQLPEERAKNLRNTGNPHSYEVRFCELVFDPKGVEKNLSCLVNEGRFA